MGRDNVIGRLQVSCVADSWICRQESGQNGRVAAARSRAVCLVLYICGRALGPDMGGCRGVGGMSGAGGKLVTWAGARLFERRRREHGSMRARPKPLQRISDATPLLSPSPVPASVRRQPSIQRASHLDLHPERITEASDTAQHADVHRRRVGLPLRDGNINTATLRASSTPTPTP